MAEGNYVAKLLKYFQEGLKMVLSLGTLPHSNYYLKAPKSIYRNILNSTKNNSSLNKPIQEANFSKTQNNFVDKLLSSRKNTIGGKEIN